MTVYQKKNHVSAKWLVALIVFLLALGITFTDVYGTPGNGGGSGNQDNYGNQNLRPNNPNTPDSPPPAAIPEPTTLLLLAGGLGAMYAVRRWRKTDA